MDATVLSRRNRIVALTRYRGADDPLVCELRRDVAVDALARHVARVVAEAQLTPAHRRRIADLLAPASAA